MGYDMSIRGEVPAAPEHDVEQARAAYEAAHAAFTARVKAREFRDFDAQMKAAREHDELWERWRSLASPDSFLLNIGGMSRHREAMLDLGMIHISNGPDFKDYPEYPSDEKPHEMESFWKAADEFTGQHGTSDNPTIPMHKFCSNDGWYVTPDEIKAALEAWEEHRFTDSVSSATIALIQTDYWKKWIDYLRLAADHDGFRVN